MSPERPVLGFAAWSGTGKTTLLVRLIPWLAQHGVRVALIKHAHHAFDVDKPGKDSYELRKAGARQVLVASGRRSALVTEHDPPHEPRLDELLARLAADAAELVLVEGFRGVPFPKIELQRAALGRPPLYPADPSIIAVATDAPVPTGSLPRLDLNDVDMIGAFVLHWLERYPRDNRG